MKKIIRNMMSFLLATVMILSFSICSAVYNARTLTPFRI